MYEFVDQAMLDMQHRFQLSSLNLNMKNSLLILASHSYSLNIKENEDEFSLISSQQSKLFV